MTVWTDGKSTFTRNDILSMLFDDQSCAEIFEEEFNELFTPIEIVQRYAGNEGYDSEFDDWLESLSDSEIEEILVTTGNGHITPVKASESRKPKSKAAPRSSKSTKPKSKASVQPRKANGQFAKKPRNQPRTNRGSNRRR